MATGLTICVDLQGKCPSRGVARGSLGRIWGVGSVLLRVGVRFTGQVLGPALQ